MERKEPPKGETELLDLEELEDPSVKDHESTETKVAGLSARDHQFTVEQPGGSAMRIWVRLVDIGKGERISLQCLSAADSFEELKGSVFSKVIESLEKDDG